MIICDKITKQKKKTSRVEHNIIPVHKFTYEKKTRRNRDRSISQFLVHRHVDNLHKLFITHIELCYDACNKSIQLRHSRVITFDSGGGERFSHNRNCTSHIGFFTCKSNHITSERTNNKCVSQRSLFCTAHRAQHNNKHHQS